MKALVTGASGFVGPYLVRALLERRDSVRAMVRDRAKAGKLPDGCEVVTGDLLDRPSLDKALAGIEVLFHLAASSSMDGEETIRRTNVDGLRNVLEAACDAQVRRAVTLSSINVLGSSDLNNAHEDFPTRRVGETHADVKIDGEELALDLHRRRGLGVTIIRPGLIYGDGERHLPKLARAIQRGKFKFLGSRDNVVPMVYVTDLVQALVLAADSPKAAGRIYHVTDGSLATIADLAGGLAERLGAPQPTKKLPYIVPWLACKIFGLLHMKGPINPTTLRFLGTSRAIDIRRAREELGYAPRVQLDEGLTLMLPSLKRQLEAGS